MIGIHQLAETFALTTATLRNEATHQPGPARSLIAYDRYPLELLI